MNTYIIIIGFRFHISLVLPLFICFNSSFLQHVNISFLNPDWKKGYYFLIFIFLPLLIELGGLFLFQKIDLGDPEYFYEFGVSSIADFPVYLLWNLPQLILLFFFLSSVSSSSRFKFISVAFVIFLLFVFELLPVNKSFIHLGDIEILIISSLIGSILINYYSNIYWFVISLFSIFWLAILAFGSNSKSIINILFASQYNSWDGFFDVAKQFAPFAMSAYFGITLLVLSITLIFSKKHSYKDNLNSQLK